MDAESTCAIVASAYKNARSGFLCRAPRTSALREVDRVIKSLRSRADTQIEVLDFKSQNRARYSQENDGVELCHTTATLGRLLEVASSDLSLGLSLYEMVLKLRPLNCVEIGACIGVSGMFIAAGLRDVGQGKLVTFEGDPRLAEIARDNIECVAPDQVEVVVGPFSETVEKYVNTMTSVQFAFSDQEHYLEPTLRDLNALAPKMPAGAVLVMDDICWNEDMLRAWEVVSADPRCAYAVTPLRFGRPARFGIWIRGDGDECVPKREEIGFPFDRRNGVTACVRRWQAQLKRIAKSR